MLAPQPGQNPRCDHGRDGAAHHHNGIAPQSPGLRAGRNLGKEKREARNHHVVAAPRDKPPQLRTPKHLAPSAHAIPLSRGQAGPPSPPQRRWLLAVGKRTARRRRQQHRQWRERKPCFGAIVQLDGSDHDWFEGRREKCVLMVMLDPATNRIGTRFFEE